MKIRYNLPDIQQSLLYAKLMEAMAINPEAFYDDFVIECVFGSVSSCIWDAGMVDIRPSWPCDKIETLAQLYNDLGLPMCLTFTNPLITKEHLHDTYANMIAKICEAPQNQILVSSPILEDYLREKYPQYKMCRSILATENKPYDASDKYYKTVLKRAWNNNWNLLDTIPENERTKIEILCNDPCPDNCPYIYSHYARHAQYQLALGNTDVDPNCWMRHVIGNNQEKFTRETKAYISHQMIVDEYLPKGFNQFKLAGRGSLIFATIAILDYLVKPEYRDDIMIHLLKDTINF